MNRASASSYDLFKTIVAHVLAAFLMLMFLGGCATNPASLAPTETVLVPEASEMSPSSPVPTETIPTSDNPPTVTASPIPTTKEQAAAPASAKGTPTSKVAETATGLPAKITSTPQAQTITCNTSVPSRLSVGQMALVVRQLNLRDKASIAAPILQTNPAGSQVEIIGGPICTPAGKRAYLWWQIRLADGTEGWSAESPLREAGYFLEPIK